MKSRGFRLYSARKNISSVLGDDLCSVANLIVFDVNVSHEGRDSFVSGKRHTDLQWNTGIGYVGSRTVANPVRSNMK